MTSTIREISVCINPGQKYCQHNRAAILYETFYIPFKKGFSLINTTIFIAHCEQLRHMVLSGRWYSLALVYCLAKVQHCFSLKQILRDHAIYLHDPMSQTITKEMAL